MRVLESERERDGVVPLFTSVTAVADYKKGVIHCNLMDNFYPIKHALGSCAMYI